MSLGCGASVAKVVLVVVNTIFLLLGLGIGIAGLVFRFGTDLLGDEIKKVLEELKIDVVGGNNVYEIAQSISLLLIIVGFFIFIIGALGCCGACCQNRVLLVIYAIIVVLLLIAQIAGVVLFSQFRSSFDSTLKESFKTALKDKYNVTGNADFTNSMNSLFKLYKCCGVDSVNDLTDNNKPIPQECCTVTTPCNSGNANEGCLPRLEDQINQYNTVFIAVGVSILVFQLLCVLFAFCLCVAIGREDIV